MHPDQYEQASKDYENRITTDAKTIVLAAFTASDQYNTAVNAVIALLKKERGSALSMAKELVRPSPPTLASEVSLASVKDSRKRTPKESAA